METEFSTSLFPTSCTDVVNHIRPLRSLPYTSRTPSSIFDRLSRSASQPPGVEQPELSSPSPSSRELPLLITMNSGHPRSSPDPRTTALLDTDDFHSDSSAHFTSFLPPTAVHGEIPQNRYPSSSLDLHLILSRSSPSNHGCSTAPVTFQDSDPTHSSTFVANRTPIQANAICSDHLCRGPSSYAAADPASSHQELHLAGLACEPLRPSL